MSHVPPHLPIRVGAALTGRSERAFRRDVWPLVRDDRGNVSLAGLQGYMQREIRAETYLAAVASLEPRRARERAYKRNAA